MATDNWSQNEIIKHCKPYHLRRNELEIKLLCQTCDLIINLPEIGTHQHIDNLRRLVIRHYFCTECKGRFIVCTCKCGNELGQEPVSKWIKVPDTSIVECWPCGQIYNFRKADFKDENKEILYNHPVSSLHRNNASIIKSFNIPEHI